MQRIYSYIFLLTVVLCLGFTSSYSSFEDDRIINAYKAKFYYDTIVATPNHAQIARKLVHQTLWASVGTISTNDAIKGYPMVNIKSINDNDANGKSTGRIQFLLTDLDFTGIDWHANNKVTFFFTDEQLQHCTMNNIDPMEPTCARAIISGQIVKMDKNSQDYESSLKAFIDRHPAAINWIKMHSLYLCELNIKNIFVLDYYGGAHTVDPIDYFKTQP